MNKITLTFLSLMCSTMFLFSQANIEADMQELSTKISETLGISDVDLLLTKSFTSSNSNVVHSYYNQVIDGIEVYNAVSNISRLADGTSFHSNVRAHAVNTDVSSAIVKERDALQFTQNHFNLPELGDAVLDNTLKNNGAINRYNDPSLSTRQVAVKPVYYPDGDQLLLAWSVAFEKIDNQFWHDVIVSAVDGQIIRQVDWTVECAFDHDDGCSAFDDGHDHNHVHDLKSHSFSSDGSYTVFALPLESPSEGERTVELAPWENAATASPYGWHDTDGVMGAEFTITRGNNVLASEDRDGNNATQGASPDGGADLVFDFPIDLATQQPVDYVDAATVNLFYWNNVVHDVLYEHGFDEASGNFQENNYGNGALENDFVFADAQDGSGTNNATFGTPPDGSNPRMTMFEWNVGAGPASEATFTVDSPGDIAGDYIAIPSTFGPQDITVTGDMILVDDGVGTVTDGCESSPAGSLTGAIAIVDRGGCNFNIKVVRARLAGAAAVIICNNVPGPPTAPGGNSPAETIPSAMVGMADCDVIKVALQSGPVTATLSVMPSTATGPLNLDSDLDNGIIAHEYGHGWSTRLTGGAGNSGCLSGNEQMGEGWSDYLGLVMTIKPGELSTDGRGIGTYVITEDSLGGGIRPFPYSTDFNVNPHTYADIASEAVPHGVGSVWCVMLWDMTWLLIDRYGFDADLYNGSGGNNVALTLVSEGLMLQGCNPGFVDGRDGILAADMALFGGANQCIIWEAFSGRGLGFSADQGTSGSATDGTEAFDLPPDMCFGCTDPSSVNFDPDVTQDDGSCFSCSDGILNGNETEVDCGGADCMPCFTCDDGILNGNEEEIDCGGPDCPACPTCDDGTQNGDEEGVDCGGTECPVCPTCDDGIMNGDEEEIDCGGTVCAPCPTCNDGIMNGDEEMVDCGGTECPVCPTCDDGIMNGDEDDVDCGGSVCADCPCTDIVLLYDGSASAIDIPDGTDRFVRDYIESQGDVTIQAGTLIQLRAGQVIEIMADFEVAQGGELLLDIANCDDSGINTSVIEENDSPKKN